MRLGTGLSGATLVRRIARDEPPLPQKRTYGLPITQTELADAFGLSTVHVNRTLQDLRDDGLITLQGKTLVINDWERLQQVAQFDPEYLHADQRIERD